MRALVTGATGCVGANVVEALFMGGYEVRALRRDSSRPEALYGLEPEMVIGDVLQIDSLIKAMSGCDLVFHVAAVSEYWRASPERIYDVNVNGTRNVFEAAAYHRVQRIVFTSSVAVLGKPRFPGEVLNESHSYNHYPIPFHYGLSKMLAEAEVQRYVGLGMDAVIVNPSSVIGQRDVNFIGGELIRAAKKGWFIAAPPGGMGIISARDAGLGHVLAAERGKTGQRYILNSVNISHSALMRIVAEATGSAYPRITLKKSVIRALAFLTYALSRKGIRIPGVDPIQLYLSSYNMYFDQSKAVKELGFDPFGVRHAVEQAVTWYQQQNML
ncbi:MAG: NAD-dependent epimerase/dehydratase family protein [Anaerolineae bacterium]|nr:NAD-dependent epimerase/dehydratase family protein [Anaerolineae bacterium]